VHVNLLATPAQTLRDAYKIRFTGVFVKVRVYTYLRASVCSKTNQLVFPDSVYLANQSWSDRGQGHSTSSAEEERPDTSHRGRSIVFD
jgi:hypothetical protein